MFRFHWLSSLKDKLRAHHSRNRNTRRRQNDRSQAQFAQASVSRFVTESLEDRTLLTAFTVVNTNDSGTGSLREAIELANTNTGADTISFDASLSGQSIVLSNELVISDDLTITGLGSDQLTIDGNANNRIFNIDDSSTITTIDVEIRGLRLTGGYSENGGAIYNLEDLTVSESTIDYSHATKNGGGIYHDLGELTVISSTVAYNQAQSDQFPGTSGGGIYNKNVLSVFNSTISSIYATFGGGIYALTGEELTVINSTIVLNTAYLTGGGIELSFSNSTIHNSIIAGNIKEFGSLTIDSQIRGTPKYASYNLIRTSIDGVLDPVLAGNGGSTQTHALIADSFAINRGNNIFTTNAGLDFDQRDTGFNRIIENNVDLGAVEYQGPFTQIDLRILNSKTSTDGNGEISTLPDSLSRVDEWSGYWLEIWISSSTIDLGILSATMNLRYNNEITTVTNIEYGSAFTLNQKGFISELSGLIIDLSAETSQTDVGDDQHVLFARIRFESTIDDSIDLDLQGQRLNSQSPDFSIGQPEVIFVGGSPSEEIHGSSPDTQIWATPYDLNDDDAINFRDLMLFASVYNTIPSESNSNYSWFADVNQSNSVNFRDLIFFITNYGKSKLNRSAIVYPQDFPDDWNHQLLVDTTQGEPQLVPASLSQSAVDQVLDSVVVHVSPQLTPSQNETLENIDIQVLDLEGDRLGRAVSSTIYIDVNAAGYGWFVNATPAEYSEFEHASQLSLIALPDNDAAGRVDLWSVTMHEIGHLLGYDHEEEGLMQDTPAPGARKLPTWEWNIDLENNSMPEEADLFFLTIQNETELVPL